MAPSNDWAAKAAREIRERCINTPGGERLMAEVMRKHARGDAVAAQDATDPLFWADDTPNQKPPQRGG